MNARQTDFSKGSVSRNILDVAVPMITAQILHLLYNIVDRIYIGRIPGIGVLALTGVGLCLPVISLITAFSNLFGMGGAPLCSMQRGRGDDAAAREIMQTSFCALLITGVVLTALGLMFYKPALYLLGASDDTFSFAEEYIGVYMYGTVFVMASLGMNPFINAQGFGRVGMTTVLFGAVANIILDPLFIFTFGMGIRGAAVATVISQLLSAIWVLKFLTGRDAVLKIDPLKFSVNTMWLKRIVSLGLSNFVMGMTNTIVQTVCNVTVQFYGGDLYVGVMTVLNSVREIFTLPLSGLSNGAIPVMSFNYGAKAFGNVKRAIRFVFIAGLSYAALAWLLVLGYPKLFARIFTTDAELLSASVSAMHIYFFGFVMMSCHMTGQYTFVALGKAKHATFFSLFRKVFVVVPLTLLFPKLWGWGVDGVFAAEAVSNVASGVLCFGTMVFVVRKEMN